MRSIACSTSCRAAAPTIRPDGCASWRAVGDPVRPGESGLAAYPVPQVRGVAALQDPDRFELDVLRTERLEEAPSLPEQHRHQVDLDLVELPGPQQCLRGP